MQGFGEKTRGTETTLKTPAYMSGKYDNLSSRNRMRAWTGLIWIRRRAFVYTVMNCRFA